MRVNIYAEELLQDVRIVAKDGHHGVRIYLASSPLLHHTPEDDDRTAVTFWSLDRSRQVFASAIAAIDRALAEKLLGRAIP